MSITLITLFWDVEATVSKKKFDNKGGWVYALTPQAWDVRSSDNGFSVRDTKEMTAEVYSCELASSVVESHQLDEEIYTIRTGMGRYVLDEDDGALWMSWQEGRARVHFLLGSKNNGSISELLDTALVNTHLRVALSFRIDLYPEEPKSDIPYPWSEDFWIGVDAFSSDAPEIALVSRLPRT